MKEHMVKIKGKRVRHIRTKREGIALCINTKNRGLKGERDMLEWIPDGEELEIESPINNMELLEIENLSVWLIEYTKHNSIIAQIGIPNIGDTDIQVFDHEGNGKFLITLPEFNWCSYVGDFEKFEKSEMPEVNFAFQGFRGYYLTMGDVKVSIKELIPYVTELKLIFSLLLSLLYKKVTMEKYINVGTDITIEEHIKYCKEQLQKSGVRLLYNLNL